MESFKTFQKDILTEKLITFGMRAYPKFNNVVILQGGAGSGKGFIKDKLVGVEGIVFDVDELKSLAINSKAFAKQVKDETGFSLGDANLKKPEHVFTVHTILSDKYSLDKKWKTKSFNSIASAHPDRKPNIIFDVTGKNLKKFQEIYDSVTTLGYKSEDIHVVWVLDEVDSAIKKNKERSRTVPEDILLKTHEGAALTAKKLLSMGSSIKKYFNGDFWLVFNKMKVDSEVKFSDRGGMYIASALYFKLKSKGKSPTSPDKLQKDIYQKIRAYAPDAGEW